MGFLNFNQFLMGYAVVPYSTHTVNIHKYVTTVSECYDTFEFQSVPNWLRGSTKSTDIQSIYIDKIHKVVLNFNRSPTEKIKYNLCFILRY